MNTGSSPSLTLDRPSKTGGMTTTKDALTAPSGTAPHWNSRGCWRILKSSSLNRSDCIYEWTSVWGQVSVYDLLIQTYETDGSGGNRLAENASYDSLLSWSPDGSRLIYNSSQWYGNADIYSVAI